MHRHFCKAGSRDDGDPSPTPWERRWIWGHVTEAFLGHEGKGEVRKGWFAPETRLDEGVRLGLRT